MIRIERPLLVLFSALFSCCADSGGGAAPQAQDEETFGLENLGLVARNFRIDGSHVGLIAAAGQFAGNSSSEDEYLLHWYDLDSRTLIDTGLRPISDELEIMQGRIYVLGEGHRLIGYEIASGTSRDFGPALYFRATPRRLAYWVSEFLEGVDLNGDGDLRDDVLHFHDPVSTMTTSTATAASSGFVSSQEGDPIIGFAATELSQGQDLNQDGDLDDTIPHAYDIRTEEIRTFDHARSFRFRNSRLMRQLFEFQEGDLNNDGDTDDRFVHIDDAVLGSSIFSAPNLNVLGFDGDRLALALAEGGGDLDPTDGSEGWSLGILEIDSLDLRTIDLPIYPSGIQSNGVLLFEVDERSGGVDLNLDGDAQDPFLLYAIELETGRVSGVGLNAFATSSRVADERYVLFTAPESFLFEEDAPPEVINGDLNGDGDTDDFELYAFDLVTGQLIPSGISRAATYFDSFSSPRLLPDVATFAIDEGEADLNGDQDSFDDVAYSFDTASRTFTNHELAVEPYHTETQATDGASYFLVNEKQQSADLNGDGEIRFSTRVVFRYRP